jgi:hypothetical protein
MGCKHRNPVKSKNPLRRIKGFFTGEDKKVRPITAKSYVRIRAKQVSPKKYIKLGVRPASEKGPRGGRTEAIGKPTKYKFKS